MAASVAINDMKNALQGGARSNKYRVYLEKIGDSKTADLLCKSSSFPGKTIGEIEVWNQGRKLIIPGDTSFTNEWTLSFYNTQDHKLRLNIIEWMRQIDDFKENKHASDVDSISSEMKVFQINADGSEGQGYIFYNVFPKDIGEITVEDESADAIQEFDVSFSFTNWEII
jgi:hypothetical protein